MLRSTVSDLNVPLVAFTAYGEQNSSNITVDILLVEDDSEVLVTAIHVFIPRHPTIVVER